MLKIEAAYDRLDEIRTLFREYQTTMKLDLCFQNFEDELAALPGKYSPPRGRLYIAVWNGAAAGCIALRPFGDDCEMKRLYVRERFRGLKIGAALAEKIIAEAKTGGYGRMVLDTYAGTMREAVALYRKLGFRETEPYYNNPGGDALFLELELRERPLLPG